MNQDFNNFNQNNFNNQNNNVMPNNQPVFGVSQQTNFNQPQQHNNMIPNQPKKNNLALIIGIIAVVVIAIVICVLMFGKDSSSSSNSNEEKENNPNTKTITYFNSSSVGITDKISFNLEASSEDGKGIFFGISSKGVANNLKNEYSLFRNDVFTLSKYALNDEVSIQYNDQYFIFELEGDSYLKDDTGEYLDNQAIVYKDGNYLVTENNIDSYTLYYLYDEDYYDGFRDGKTHGYWYTLHISYPDTLEEAKARISEIKSNIDICVYDKKEGYDNCLTDEGKKIDYKKYKHIKDVLIDSLIDYNLYVDSYENITQVKSGEIYVEKYIALDGVSEDEFTKFEIDFQTGTISEEEKNATSTLNGQKVSFRKSYSLHYAYLKQSNGYIEILVDLPYGAEETDENAIKAFTETFSKTK